MSFCLFELARNLNIQKRIQEEIDRVVETKGHEEVTYEMMGEMKYLECCIDETLRKYPIVPNHFRTAGRDYKISGSQLIIPKGSSVFIPALGFHRDPNIFKKPMDFMPERFLTSSKGGGESEGAFYTPFGDGPRSCIGSRMGKLTTKVGLFVILTKYNLELSDKAMVDRELEFNAKQFVLTAKKPFFIKIIPR